MMPRICILEKPLYIIPASRTGGLFFFLNLPIALLLENSFSKAFTLLFITIHVKWATPTCKQHTQKQQYRLTMITVACPCAFLWPARVQSSSSICFIGTSPIPSTKFEVQESKLCLVTTKRFQCSTDCYRSCSVSIKNFHEVLLFICC